MQNIKLRRVACKVLQLLLASTVMQSANAGEYCWNEMIQQLIVQGDGIYFTTDKSCPSWCSINSAWSSDAKKRAYAAFMIARTAQRGVAFYWSPHATSCAGAVPTYAAPDTVIY